MRRPSVLRVAFAGVLFFFAVAIVSPAQTFNTIFSFNSTDGNGPNYGPLIQGTDGNLYGMTFLGGANGQGTVFQISPAGTLTTLYNFCSKPGCADGSAPEGGLVQTPSGTFYGTTWGGGTINSNCPSGCGTVFKITGSGILTTLYSFCSRPSCTDGEYPAGLVLATDGNFYGTTYAGGSNGIANGGFGTAFKITPTGVLTKLLNFNIYGTGANPRAGLVQGTDGNFYGTTYYGGSGGPNKSYGTIFKMTRTGTVTVLHSFSPPLALGVSPMAPLIQASNGNFYGTTSQEATVFEITPAGTATALYTFCTLLGCPDGFQPFGGLVQGTDGNLYGTTFGGGNGINDGTVFEITLSGTLTTIYKLCSQANCADGSHPYAGLLQATNGDFYGTTGQGGASNYGTIYSLSVGLGPFVKTLTTSGKVGTPVIILGTNLTGTTSVKFNGTPATFKVVSQSEIKAMVPTGATTGTVEVTTPTMTLDSNVVFYVQ